MKVDYVCMLQLMQMFNLSNKSCPYANWVATARESCADPDRYHCLNDEFARPGWICVDPIWVEAGRCPEYNTVAKKMDSVKCDGSNCPISPYQSSLSHLYEDCRTARTNTTKSSISSIFTSTQSTKNENPPTSFGVVLGPVFGIIALLSISFLIFYCRRKKKFKSGSKDPEENVVLLETQEADAKTALGRTLRALRTERFVVLTGIQGAGKTFLAERLYEEWIKGEKLWIRHLDQIPEEPDQRGRTSYILDDLFHELQPEDEVKEVKEKIDKLYEASVVKDTGQIILTITSLILRRHKSVFNERKYQNLIDLDELCVEDRESIFQFHMKLNNIVRSENPTSAIKIGQNDYNRVLKDSSPDFKSLVENRGIGIAASLALVCQGENRNFEENNLSRMFKTPMAWLHGSWTKQIIDKKWTSETLILAMMALQEGDLNMNEINQDRLTKIKETEDIHCDEGFPAAELEELKKKRFVETREDVVYKFQVSVDKKVIFKLILQKHPEFKALCDPEIITRRACCPETLPKDINRNCAYAKSFFLL